MIERFIEASELSNNQKNLKYQLYSFAFEGGHKKPVSNQMHLLHSDKMYKQSQCFTLS